MKYRNIVLASAVSWALGGVAFAQQEQQGMPMEKQEQGAQQGQSMEQDRSPAGASGQAPGEPEAQYKAGQGQTEPGADVKAMKEGAHSPPSSQVSADTVREVQEKLKEQGYNVGAVDGIWGPKTQSALRNFQQAKGIEASGELNQETLAAMEIEGQPMAGGAGEGAETGAAGTAPGGAEQPPEQRPGAAEQPAAEQPAQEQAQPPAGQKPQRPGQ